MTAPARRGASERMREELGELLTEAAQQHRRLHEEIAEEGSAALGFTDAQQQALAAPLQLEVIVTLEAMTVWATHAHELRRVGVFPGDRQVPWVLSIMDLMAVTDLLEGANLVHYLARRQRIERDGRIYAHDELDWVGHYLTEGLFFDAYFDGEDPPTGFSS